MRMQIEERKIYGVPLEVIGACMSNADVRRALAAEASSVVPNSSYDIRFREMAVYAAQYDKITGN